MRVPYIVGRWVRDHNHYGRQRLFTYLLNTSDSAVWVVGSRRIGKTSLLRQLEYLTDTPESDLVPLFWDMQGCANSGDLSFELFMAVEDEAARFAALGVTVGELEGQDALVILRRVGRALAARGKTLLLLIDEAEVLINLARSEPGWLARLRKVLQDGHQRTILTSTKLLAQLNEITADWETSPFLFGFSMVNLWSLDDDAAAALVEQRQSDQPIAGRSGGAGRGAGTDQPPSLPAAVSLPAPVRRGGQRTCRAAAGDRRGPRARSPAGGLLPDRLPAPDGAGAAHPAGGGRTHGHRRGGAAAQPLATRRPSGCGRFSGAWRSLAMCGRWWGNGRWATNTCAAGCARSGRRCARSRLRRWTSAASSRSCRRDTRRNHAATRHEVQSLESGYAALADLQHRGQAPTRQPGPGAGPAAALPGRGAARPAPDAGGWRARVSAPMQGGAAYGGPPAGGAIEERWRRWGRPGISCSYAAWRIISGWD